MTLNPLVSGHGFKCDGIIKAFLILIKRAVVIFQLDHHAPFFYGERAANFIHKKS
jgi:hypothetical protein